MNKKILLLFVLFSYKLFSQGLPACPSVVAGLGTGGTISVCTGGCTSLAANVVTNNQTTTYTVNSIPYAPFAYSSPTSVAISVNDDDVWSPVVSLGFNFCFFGTSYNQVLIGANGDLTFDLTQATNCTFGPPCTNPYSITTALPFAGGNATDSDVPPNSICAAFRDIDLELGGTANYYITGTSPCRSLVISWVDVPLYDNDPAGGFSCVGTPNSTFQLILYENTNFIDVYIQNSFSCSDWNEGSGIIGIQNANATVAYCPPGRNYPNTWTANNEAWRFSPTGPPSYTITWKDQTGNIGTGSTINVCPSTTTTYTADMVVTNCDGSTLDFSDTLTIKVIPGTPITVNSATICASSGSATLTANGASTYSWAPSGTLSSSTGSTVTANPSANIVYTVTATSGAGLGCSPTATSTVTVIPNCIVSVNSETICSGATTTLTATGGADSYSWAPANGLNSTNVAVVTANPTTTTIYTVTGTYTVTGNTSVATSTVMIIPTTTVAVASATICATKSVTLVASGATNYSWSPSAGLSGTTGTSVFAAPAGTTVYTITSTPTSTCSTPGTCTVTVIPNCTITVNSATVCPAGTATLTAHGADSYAWSPSTGLNVSTGSVVISTPGATTIYTVTGTFTVTGNTSVATSTVLVAPTPTLTVNNTSVCSGSTATLTATGNALNYTWAGTDLVNNTGAEVTATPTISTTYTVTGISSHGCTNTAVAAVGVNASPTTTINPIDTAGCTPLTVQFRQTNTSAGLSYAWIFNDGGTSSLAAPSHTFAGQGAYTVKLTVTDAVTGCAGKSISTVTVYPLPVAQFNASPQPVTILDPLINFTDQTTHAVVSNWSWTFGDYYTAVNSSSVRNPTHLYQDTGSYLVHLVVGSNYGCKDSTSQIIRIDEEYELFVPTAFTPNGDGKNDVFLPVGDGISEAGYNLFVYDRWGNMLFHTTNMYKGWDGSRNGTTLQEDVYVWKITLKTTKGKSKQAKGQVTILR